MIHIIIKFHFIKITKSNFIKIKYSEVIYVAFARLTFAKLRPDADLQEARKVWDESIAPAAKSQKGFISCFLIVTEDANEGIAVTLWESKEDAVAGEESGYSQEQVNKFGAFLAAPPDRKHYIVNSEITLI